MDLITIWVCEGCDIGLDVNEFMVVFVFECLRCGGKARILTGKVYEGWAY